MSGEEPLAEEVAELERIAEGLRDPAATADTLRRLADEALAVSRRITELLPQALADPPPPGPGSGGG